MTAKITLTWDNGSSEHVDQIVYRSAETFTVDNLPPVLARVGRNAREYTDTDIVTGNVYYYAVASENAVGEILLSSVISVTAGASTGDPHWDKVVSLLHFDGADGSTTFDDVLGFKWTASGAVQIDTAQAGPFGGACGLFKGLGNYLSIPASSAFAFGTADFTIELWFRPRIANVYHALFYTGNYETNQLSLRVANAGKLQSFINNGVNSYGIVTGTTSLVVGEWHHILMSSSAGTIRTFLNGVLETSAANSISIASSGAVYIGGQNVSGNVTLNPDGHIDELRITKGVARYTENFTPPTEPFPNF